MQPIDHDRLQEIYHEPNNVLNMMSYIYNIAFVILLFPSTYVIDNYGCRTAVLIGVCGTTIGMILKVFIN